jgi:hypothetical protein
VAVGLLANPDATAVIGGDEVPVTATLLTGDDRELWVFALTRRG